MNLSPVSPSRHYLACTVCAVPFVGSVSVDSRMKPRHHTAHSNEAVIVSRKWRAIITVFGCLLAYCKGVPRGCFHSPRSRWHGRGSFQGKDEQRDERCRHISTFCSLWNVLASFQRTSNLTSQNERAWMNVQFSACWVKHLNRDPNKYTEMVVQKGQLCTITQI